jgi:hypothetical protein
MPHVVTKADASEIYVTVCINSITPATYIKSSMNTRVCGVFATRCMHFTAYGMNVTS